MSPYDSSHLIRKANFTSHYGGVKIYMGASILYPTPPQKIQKKSTGKMHRNEFFNRVLAPGTYPAGFLLKNGAQNTNQISISIFLDQIRARFDVFLNFSRKKIGPSSSRYRQLLLKPYNHLSEVSSSPIGPL